MISPEGYGSMMAKSGGSQEGGFIPLAAIPPILGSIAALKSIKPISFLDEKLGLSRIPLVGSITSGLRTLGFGDGQLPSSPADTIHPSSGVYQSTWDDRMATGTRFFDHQVAVPPQSGQMSVPTSSGGRKKRGGARKYSDFNPETDYEDFARDMEAARIELRKANRMPAGTAAQILAKETRKTAAQNALKALKEPVVTRYKDLVGADKAISDLKARLDPLGTQNIPELAAIGYGRKRGHAKKKGGRKNKK